MSNSSTNRQDDLRRTIEDFPNYLYPGTANMNFTTRLRGVEQSRASGGYHANTDLSAVAQVRTPTFSGGGMISEARTSSHPPDDDRLYKKWQDATTMPRDFSPGTDHNKGLGNVTGLSTTLRKDFLPDSTLRRNFQKCKEQRSSFLNMTAYSHLQPGHPSVDPQISGLPPYLTPTTVYSPSLFNQTYPYDMLALFQHPYNELDHSIRDASPYGVGRTALAGHNYPGQSTVGLGQSGSRLHSYHDYHMADAEQSLHGKYLSPYNANPHQLSANSVEIDLRLASGLPSRLDSYSQRLSSYPHLEYGKTGPSARFYSSALSQNGLNKVDPQVIDLTCLNSPDIGSSDSVHHRGWNALSQDHLYQSNENEGCHPRDVSEQWNSGRGCYTASSQYSGMPMPSFGSVPGVSSPAYSISIPSAIQSSANTAAQTRETRATDLLRYLPAPFQQQHDNSDAASKNTPALGQYNSKSVPQHSPPGLTFNYPEGSGSKPQSHMAISLGNGFSPPKSHVSPSKVGCKLSLENHVVDSAGDEKSCIGFGTFDTVPLISPRFQHSHCGTPVLKTHSISTPSAVSCVANSAADLLRYSVVQSPSKMLVHCEGSAPLEETRTLSPEKTVLFEPPICPTGELTTTNSKDDIRNENGTIIEKSVVLLKTGRKRKTLIATDGEQTRKKRKYTKRSDVWKKKGSHPRKKKQKQNIEDGKGAEEPNGQITISEPPPTEKAEGNIPGSKLAAVEKSSRPQRKSSGVDMDEEYLYAWFTDEETENDDSSDKDYNCGTKANKYRTRGGSKPLRWVRRRSDSNGNLCFADRGYCQPSGSHCRKRTTKRGRRKVGIGRKSDESTCEKVKLLEKVENVEESPLQRLDFFGEKKKESVAPLVDNPAANIGDDHVDCLLEKTHGQCQPTVDNSAKKTKRKYTRRLDKDGRPIKRAKKVIKSMENVTRKRKNSKTVGKLSDHLPSEKLGDVDAPLPLTPTLDGVYPDDGRKKAEYGCTKQNELTQKHDTTTSRLRQGDVSTNTTDPSQPQVTGASIKQSTDNVRKFRGAKSKDPNAAEPGTAISGHAVVKIKKKRGRKPGWRKHPQGVNLPVGAKGVLKTKYKKPKGDGLCRFGMRKRVRRPKLALSSSPRHSTTSNIAATPLKSEDPNKEQKSLLKSKRKYNMSSRLEKKRLRLLTLGKSTMAKDNMPKSSRSLKTTMVHEISKELQSQEYDYDFRSSSFCKDENHEDDMLIATNVQDGNVEQPLLSTPMKSGMQSSILTTPACTPWPSNFKKLCCNSAIGETSLHKAARMCYMENLQYYLENGTNVNQSDNAGYTALHEACVQNHLEAASLLLQYNIDVNKYASDGTRPLHDAVEYDHLEMVRLLLACGADPMLSKFSGRSIRNMVRSDRMRKFLEGYLQELKEIKSGELFDKELEWKFPCSAVFDKSMHHRYKTLDFAPDAEELFVEFEMYEEEPICTYLLQPDEEVGRANYILLDDYLKAIDHRHCKSTTGLRITVMRVEQFQAQIRESKLQSLQNERRRPKPDLSGEFVELVAIDDEEKKLLGAETIRIPVFENRNATEDNMLHQPNRNVEKSSVDQSADKNLDSTQPHPIEDLAINGTENSLNFDIPLVKNYTGPNTAEVVVNKRRSNNRLKRKCLMEKVKELASYQNDKPGEELPSKFDVKLVMPATRQPLPSDNEIYTSICS